MGAKNKHVLAQVQPLQMSQVASLHLSFLFDKMKAGLHGLWEGSAIYMDTQCFCEPHAGARGPLGKCAGASTYPSGLVVGGPAVSVGTSEERP